MRLKLIEDTRDIIIIEQVSDHDKWGLPLALVACPCCGKRRLMRREHIRNLQSTWCTYCNQAGKRHYAFRFIENTKDIIVIEQIARTDGRNIISLVECPGCGERRLMHRCNIRRRGTWCTQCHQCSGEEVWNWKGGYSRAPYPNDWDKIATGIRERDLHECQFPSCDATSAGEGYRLHVHHIIPLSDGGSNDEWNLVSLCVKHHSWADGNLDKSMPLLNKIIGQSTAAKQPAAES